MTTPSNTARKIAEKTSFQAFANCYLREVDSGAWAPAASWQAQSSVRLEHGETHVVELELASQSQTLALGVRFRSLVGRHSLTEVYRRRRFHLDWQRVDGVTALLVLIDALYAESPESERRLALLGRVIESHQVMARYVERWLKRGERAPETDASPFLDSERSVVLGHWLHPTPKSRQGMLDWQHAHYSHELCGRFQLHFFAAAREHVAEASLLHTSAAQISLALAQQGADAATSDRLAAFSDGFAVLPIHPLQAHWLLHQDYVRGLLADGKLVDLGRLGPAFTPTSSVRTLYSESADLMVKLSIPVKITNSLRINLQSELGDSVWISQLVRKCGLVDAFPELRVIEDPAYISLTLPGLEESGFEVIYRANPFRTTGDTVVHSIAALAQDPVGPGERSRLADLVRQLADSEGVSLSDASRRWFDSYWNCAIAAPVRIYDRYGICLEAHQQNALLDFTAAGAPRHAYYRDIQGIGLSECHRDALLELVPELADQEKVFEPDEIVRHNFGYYVFFNQLYAVVNRFALDGLLDEATLLGVIRAKLLAMRLELGELGQALVDTLVESKAIPCKANLLTRVADMDELEVENELAVYTPVPNPLHMPQESAPRALAQVELAAT